MNTPATSLSNLSIDPLSMLRTHRTKIRVWAFAAAVRLSDLDRPIVLKLLVELAIIIRALALVANDAPCAAGKTAVSLRTRLAASRIVLLADQLTGRIKQRYDRGEAAPCNRYARGIHATGIRPRAQPYGRRRTDGKVKRLHVIVIGELPHVRQIGRAGR